VARVARRWRTAAAGRRSLCPSRQGALRLHGVRVVSATAGWGPRRVPDVREPREPGREELACPGTPPLHPPCVASQTARRAAGAASPASPALRPCEAFAITFDFLCNREQ